MAIAIENLPDKIRQYVGGINYYLLLFLICIVATDILCTWVPLTRWMPHELAAVVSSRILPFSVLFTLTIIYLFLPISVFISIVYLILYAVGKFRDKTKLRSLITTFFVLLAAAFSVFLEINAREFAFTALGERSSPLIEAIKSYARDNGALPESLKALVPKYIPKIPSTGLSAYPEYKFKILEQKGQKSYTAWYDLGSRNGEPMRGAWLYPYGKSGHSIVVVHYLEDGAIEKLSFDRLPEVVVKKKFSPEAWKNNPEQRLEISYDFYREIYHEHMNITQLKEQWGEPDAVILNKSSSWELLVNCSTGILNWDVFFYWPTEDYPERIYGGYVKQMGKWAYVYE